MEQITVKKEPLGDGFCVYTSPHHTFGTDAVLLADFSKSRKQEKLVDIGTGCGIIPLLLFRDNCVKSAVGIDISEEACTLCEIIKSELDLSNFTVINSDIKEIKGKTEFGCNSLVTCNPPYKAATGGLKNEDSIICTARHEVACSLTDIVSAAAKMLQTSGRLCICHRPERLAELMDIMRENKIEPKRLRLVAQRIGKEPWLVLLEGKKCANTGLRIMPTLYVEDENGDFSGEMLKIYGKYKENYI